MTQIGIDTFEATHGIHVDWDAEIPLSDGTNLRADVYRPESDTPCPVLMSLGPYAKGFAFQDYAPIQWRQLTAEHPEVVRDTSGLFAQWETVDPEKWVPHGYAVVRVDARGTGRSAGFMDPWSSRERHDYYECIEWAAAQPWCSGKIGLSGISYHAANQWMVATLKPPHLAAICVWEGMADFYRDGARHGGILCDFWLFWIKKQAAKMQHGLGSRSARSRANGRLVTGEDNFSDEVLTSNRSSFENDLLEHELLSPFYGERSGDPAMIDIPLLSAGNWGGHGLHLRGNVEAFLAAASEQKWLEIHGLEHWTEFYTDYGIELQRRFFDYFLKDANNDWPSTPRVQLQIRRPTGFALRAENEWPLARTQWTRFYLRPEDRTLSGKPPAQHSETTYEGFGAGATFISAPLETETEITGPAALKLFVSSSTTDADIFAVLRAFDPAGKELLFSGAVDPNTPLGQGWLRASHRKLDPVRSTPYRPYHRHDEHWPLTPGARVELDVEMWPTCIVLPAGYRIAVTVQGKDYDEGGQATISNAGNTFRGSGGFTHTDPRDRDPAIFAGVTTIYSGPSSPSYVLLPVIPADRSPRS